MKRQFYVDFGSQGNVIIELDEKVINVVDDEWRSQLYSLETPEDISGHIAYNLIQGLRLSQLDGWADQPDENARIVENNMIDNLEINFVTEVT